MATRPSTRAMSCKLLLTRRVYFVEQNHPSYSLDIAPTDYHMFSHLKEFLRGNSFGSNDEVITTLEDYSSNLESQFFLTE
jgi:hypothetical protein